MPFDIVRNDITNMQVDAIVNAASRLPRVNAGVDSAIHKKAGPSLLAARKKIGYIQPGTAAITPAFGLDAEYVIHAATPTWIDGLHGEAESLRAAYDMYLDLAAEYNCDSIAFPLLASGNHGFPKSKALQIAIGAFSAFLMDHDMQIYLVVFSRESVKLSEKLVHNVRCYIDENYVTAFEEETYGGSNERYRRERYRAQRVMEMQEERMMAPCTPTPCEKASVDLTVMTIAVAEALISAPDDEGIIRKRLIQSMQKWGHRYPGAGYGLRFSDWLDSDDPRPYGSYGNGSAMRVSSVAWLYDDLDTVRRMARLSAEVTHNHPEGIKDAEATASAIFLARSGSTKAEIKAYVEAQFGYDLSRTCDEIRPSYRHVESCQETAPEAITAFLDGDSFEDVIRTAVSLGGDCDTLTCIAGSIAEGLYGVPEKLKHECRRRLPGILRDILSRFDAACQ